MCWKPECEIRVIGHGLCDKHYQRLRQLKDEGQVVCWICDKPQIVHQLCSNHYYKIRYAFNIGYHGRKRILQRQKELKLLSRSRNELLRKLAPEELIAIVEGKR